MGGGGKAFQLVGTALFVGVFLLGGLGHFAQQEKLQAETAAHLAPYGVPSSLAPALFWGATALQLLGSLLLVVGVFLPHLRKLGCLLLVLFLLPVTLVMHAFWRLPEGSQEQSMHMVHFLKNTSMLGGLLLLWGSACSRKGRCAEEDVGGRRTASGRRKPAKAD
ncbi:Nucleoside-diphosphate-sugar epimerases [Balamuthia mandrillaris]